MAQNSRPARPRAATARAPAGTRASAGKKKGRPGHAAHRPGTPQQARLYATTDNGPGVVIPSAPFLVGRDEGWERLADAFLRLNEPAIAALDITPRLEPGKDGLRLHLLPAGRAGAVPLRSGQTGQVAGGLLVRPRFGWAGIGQVLSQTGWHASPEFLSLPMVPGSGREVPPWVLAGPVLARLRELLHSVRRGYREAEATITHPRGRILWNRYTTESLVRGRWHQLPCRFPELDTDPRLRRAVRWTLERLHRDLVRVGATDRVAVGLAALAITLLERVQDVRPEMPRPHLLDVAFRRMALLDLVLQRGLQAIGWIVDERGLGGGRELDGLAWQLPLDRLWEHHVEAIIRREAAETGGDVKVGRLGQTTVPLQWTDPIHRTLGHLLPDIVVHKGRSVHIVDAKYKAHLADLDEVGWRNFVDDHRAAHRADLHQVLAYASLYEAEEVRATLVYPLRRSTWEHLRARGRDVSVAEHWAGGRHVRLELRGVPFGGARSSAG
jgi:hypothetical protein